MRDTCPSLCSARPIAQRPRRSPHARRCLAQARAIAHGARQYVQALPRNWSARLQATHPIRQTTIALPSARAASTSDDPDRKRDDHPTLPPTQSGHATVWPTAAQARRLPSSSMPLLCPVSLRVARSVIPVQPRHRWHQRAIASDESSPAHRRRRAPATRRRLAMPTVRTPRT